MDDLFSVIDTAKKKVADKKSYISKLADKRTKFHYNLQKKRPKYVLKSTNDMKYISKLIDEMEECEQIHLMSNAFDSPSLLFSIDKRFKVKKAICSTWAITDRGLQVFQDLSEGSEVFLLLDKTYSYKWVFDSGAINHLKNVKMKFTENHSKVMLIETVCGKFYSFVGSMNLSNNPRLENVIISLNKEIFQFYEQTILNEFE
jgi:GR25 family glycosyltransferase involved in LPS biosynthesis